MSFSVCVCESLSHVQLFATPWLQPTRLLCPWDSPGKNTGVSSHYLLQGIFLTQGLNPGLLRCRQILYHLSHQGRWYQRRVPTAFTRCWRDTQWITCSRAMKEITRSFLFLKSPKSRRGKLRLPSPSKVSAETSPELLQWEGLWKKHVNNIPKSHPEL